MLRGGCAVLIDAFARVSDRFHQCRVIADMIRKQQNQLRVRRLALRFVEVAMHVDQRFVEVVGLRQVELGDECHGRLQCLYPYAPLRSGNAFDT